MPAPETSKRHSNFDSRLEGYRVSMAESPQQYHETLRPEIESAIGSYSNKEDYGLEDWNDDQIRELLEELDKTPLYQAFLSFQATGRAFTSLLEQERDLHGINLSEDTLRKERKRYQNILGINQN